MVCLDLDGFLYDTIPCHASRSTRVRTKIVKDRRGGGVVEGGKDANARPPLWDQHGLMHRLVAGTGAGEATSWLDNSLIKTS